MTVNDLIQALQPLKGKRASDCIDDITKIARGYVINVMDPLFNVGPIDNDPSRLNVRTDEDSRITSFTIG
jgi:hypothetical protein